MKKILKLIIIIFFIIAMGGCLSSLINDKTNTPNNDDKTNTPITNEVDFSNLVYSALGDSITYGFTGDHSKPPFYNNYPNVIKGLLNLKNVNNYGKCGYLLSRHTNPNFYSMIDMVETIDINSDIISVFGGINDYANYAELGNINSNDEYTIYGALNVIATKLKEKFPNSYIFFMTPLDVSNELINSINNTKYNVDDVCKAIKNVCAKNNIDVLDVHNLGGFDTINDSFDGCHPYEIYYSNELAPLIVNFIKENYKK